VSASGIYDNGPDELWNIPSTAGSSRSSGIKTRIGRVSDLRSFANKGEGSQAFNSAQQMMIGCRFLDVGRFFVDQTG